MSETFNKLILFLMRAEDKGLITLNENYQLGLGPSLSEEAKKRKIDKNLIDIYTEISNGFEIDWYNDKKRVVGGKMHFLEMKYVLQNWEGRLYDEKDVQENDMIQYYKPFDLISEAFSCGFLITPDFVSRSIYCHNAPDPETYDLDIDFDGYMEMAKEARIFYYWPKILLDIQDGKESSEMTSFKIEMPKVFEDFNWGKFIEKYNSLRLSKHS